jgi:NTE family protein
MSEQSQSGDQKTLRAALVLGSGGARGLAHIGVIQHLQTLGIEISYISGCSMGALVGGIYAAGELGAYTEWVKKQDRKSVISLLDFSFGLQGLFKGERIIGVLREMIGDQDIEDLPIGFTAVATDLIEQKEIWLNKGPLFDAIRASIAIPTIFTPWTYRGRVLVDGGLLNPVPIAPALNHATDLIIAVNASGRRSREHPGERQDDTEVPGIFDAMSMSLDTMQSAIAKLKLAAYSPDVIIDIPRDVCTFYEFYRAGELIEIGRDRAARILPSSGEGD